MEINNESIFRNDWQFSDLGFRKVLLTSVFLISLLLAYTQSGPETNYFRPGDSTAMIAKLWRVKSPKGLVLLLPPYGGNQNYYDNSKLAGELNELDIDLAVLYAGDIGYLTDDQLYVLDSLIAKAVDLVGYDPEKLILGGFSAGGYGALKYTLHSRMENKAVRFRPRGVFSVDAPLDLERWYLAMEMTNARLKAFQREPNPETSYLVGFLNEMYGGAPGNVPEVYRYHSILTASEVEGGNARYFAEVPLLVFTEPDIGWYIEEYHLDYSGINAADQAALINLARLHGNKEARLVISSGKGYRPDMGNIRMPHSWEIVDIPILTRWISDTLVEK